MHGKFEMKKSSAIEVKAEALKAVECLSRALALAKEGYTEDEMATLHQAIGTLIGEIQMGVLEPIYVQFADLDDLT